MEDIKPPQMKETSEPKLDSVPVRRPTPMAGLSQTVDNPISTDARTMAQFASEAEMDKILEDVNKKVRAGAAAQPAKKSIFGFMKRQDKITKPSTTQSQLKPERQEITDPSSKKKRFAPVIAVAVVVALALVFFAYTAFGGQPSKQPPGQEENQQTPTSGQSLSPGDLDKLSTDIKNKARTLSKDHSFNTDGLSDSALGL